MILQKENSHSECFQNTKNVAHNVSIFSGDKKSNLTDGNQKDRQTLFLQRFKWSEMKLRLGFLHSQTSPESSSLSVRPSPEEAKKWLESFSALMESKYGVALYRAFLLHEFSNENLEFWLAVEDYKISKPEYLAVKAQKIYNNFVAVHAPMELNLDAETRMTTLTSVHSNNPDHHVFDRAQRRIQHMMEQDSYLRFLQSELFLELVYPERYPPSSNQSAAAAE